MRRTRAWRWSKQPGEPAGHTVGLARRARAVRGFLRGAHDAGALDGVVGRPLLCLRPLLRRCPLEYLLALSLYGGVRAAGRQDQREQPGRQD